MSNNRNNNSKSVNKKSKVRQESHENTVLVSNRFTILSDLVDEGETIDNIGVECEQSSEGDHMVGVKNDEHIKLNNAEKFQHVGRDGNSNKYCKDKNVNQKTLNSCSSVEIVNAIKQGKAPACVRQVDVNKLHDKCVDLQQCIKQQRNPMGFFTNFQS